MKVRINESQLRNLISECVRKELLSERYYRFLGSYDDDREYTRGGSYGDGWDFFKEYEEGDDDNPMFDNDEEYSLNTVYRENSKNFKEWNKNTHIPAELIERVNQIGAEFENEMGKDIHRFNIYNICEAEETYWDIGRDKSYVAEDPVYAKALKVYTFCSSYLKEEERLQLDEKFKELIKRWESLGFKAYIHGPCGGYWDYAKRVRTVYLAWMDPKSILRYKDFYTTRQAWMKYTEPEPEEEDEW